MSRNKVLASVSKWPVVRRKARRPWAFVLLCLMICRSCMLRMRLRSGIKFVPVPGVGHDYTKALSETVDPAAGSVSLAFRFLYRRVAG